MTTRSVERTVELPADTATVWGHIIEPELLGGWLGGPTELDPRPGGPVTFVDEDGVEHEGVVEKVTPHRCLILRWWEKRVFGLPLRRRVEITLEPAGGSTRLRLRESRIEPDPVDVHLPSPSSRRPERSDTTRARGGS